MTENDENNDLPQPSPNEKRHYGGERVKSPNDGEPNPHPDPRGGVFNPPEDPRRPYDLPGRERTDRTRTDATRATVRGDVQAHLRRHQGR